MGDVESPSAVWCVPVCVPVVVCEGGDWWVSAIAYQAAAGGEVGGWVWVGVGALWAYEYKDWCWYAVCGLWLMLWWFCGSGAVVGGWWGSVGTALD